MKKNSELKKNYSNKNQIIISDVLNTSKKFRKFNIHHVFIKGVPHYYKLNILELLGISDRCIN